MISTIATAVVVLLLTKEPFIGRMNWFNALERTQLHRPAPQEHVDETKLHATSSSKTNADRLSPSSLLLLSFSLKLAEAGTKIQ